MKNIRTFLFLLLCIGSTILEAQQSHSLTIQASVSQNLHGEHISNGRLFLFLSQDKDSQPRYQLWPSSRINIFAKNIEGWDPDEKMMLDSQSGLIKTSGFNLAHIPGDTYYIQLLWDQDTTESQINVPGNIISDVTTISLEEDLTLDIILNQLLPPRRIADHDYVKVIEFKSDTLSSWWGKSIFLKTSVLLPNSFFDDPEKKYPVRYNIAGFGGRYNRVNRLVRESNPFADWWFSDEAPQIINVFLDGEGPYGDCYQIDSENSGPYGYALIYELIPYLEREYRGLGTPESRFLDGCSTGGWVSLALQLFYPDFFNGTWSYSPDPVDFENFQLINIYEDDNAFYNEYGNLHPAARDITGDPIMMLNDFVRFENVLGSSNTYVTSGGQMGAFNALYSPKGQDGLPTPLFDPQTGDINHEIAELWKKYDLKKYVEANWKELGSKIQGKIWIWMGDMDHFYLNPAMRAFDELLKSTENPKSDAVIIFSPMKGHCSEYSHKEVLIKIAEKIGQQ